MAQQGEQSRLARAEYLDAAIKLRDMAAKAHSLETQQGLMQLAVMYQELAAYSANPHEFAADEPSGPLRGRHDHPPGAPQTKGESDESDTKL